MSYNIYRLKLNDDSIGELIMKNAESNDWFGLIKLKLNFGRLGQTATKFFTMGSSNIFHVTQNNNEVITYYRREDKDV